VSDTGGPEDPEVARLREQLAAAEREAELLAELESAQRELAALTETSDLRENPSKRSRSRTLKVSAVLLLLAGIAVVLFLVVIEPKSNGDISAGDTAAKETAAEETERPSVSVSCFLRLKQPRTRSEVLKRLEGTYEGPPSPLIVEIRWRTKNLWAENLGKMYIDWNGEHEEVTNSFNSLGVQTPGDAISFKKTRVLEKPGKKTIKVTVMNDQGQRATDSCTIWVP